MTLPCVRSLVLRDLAGFLVAILPVVVLFLVRVFAPAAALAAAGCGARSSPSPVPSGL